MRITDYDTDYSEFLNVYDTVAEEDYDKNFFGDDWKWDRCNPIGDINYFPEPHIHVSYKVIPVLKPGVESCFVTIIKYFFNYTQMNSELFHIILFQSNEYSQDKIRQGN